MASVTYTPSPLELPTPFSSAFDNVISQQEILTIVLLLVFIVWLIYTFIVMYHWIRYGHRSWIVMPVLATHVIISAALFLMAISGFANL
jgi:hypothetical protein